MPFLCPLCRQAETTFFLQDGSAVYWRCPFCEATCLDPAHLPSADAEYARYCEHDNSPEHPGYRKFLNKLAQPLLQRLPAQQAGLDYGCGPGPVLAMLLREAGHTVQLYDPFFAPHPEVLQKRYAFITCTEVVEHFHRPYEEFAFLDRLLRPGGILGIMTSFQTQDDRFGHWSYRRDPTHVTFYKEATFWRLAEIFGWRCEIPRKNVVFMYKSASSQGATSGVHWPPKDARPKHSQHKETP